MKRGITVLVSLSAVLTVAYFTTTKWAIRHETLTFNDPARDNRPVAVDIAVRRDKEMQANAGMMSFEGLTADVNKLPIEDFEDQSLVYSTATKR